jgi:hypothetical protein
MLQVVNVNLKPSFTNHIQESRLDGIAILRNNLKGTANAEGLIDVHQAGTKPLAAGVFDIMSDDGATGEPLGPKPNEWEDIHTGGLHGQCQESLLNSIDCAVDGPAGKWNPVPIPKMYLLEALTKR